MNRHIGTQEKKQPVKAALLILLVCLVSLHPVHTHGGCSNVLTGTAKKTSSLFPIVMTPLKGYYSRGVSHLAWTSLQESNSSHFDIQRSSDGINFYNIGKVKAQTVSDKVVEYAFSDAEVNDGVNYYRFKYSDNDDHFQYSNTIVINAQIKGTNITAVYPGPFTDKINVNISAEAKTNGGMRLYDNTGKIVAGYDLTLGKGVNHLAVDHLESLPNGIYVLRIVAGETVLTRTLMK